MPSSPSTHDNGSDDNRFVRAAPDWGQRLAILWERRWVLLTTFVVVVSLTLVWLFRQTPIYRATALLLAETEAVKVIQLQDVVTTDSRDFQYINTQVKMLQSRTLAEQAAKTMKLDQDREFLGEAGPDADVAGLLQGAVTVVNDRNTRLISVMADHPNPQVAARLANGVAEEFIRQNLARRMSTSMEAINWLGRQAEEIRPKLEKSEAALRDYREKSQAVSLEERQNIVVDKLKAISAALTSAQTERMTAEAQWNELQSHLDKGKNPLESPVLTTSPVVADLQKQLSTKQIAIVVLRERYTDLHPTMISALSEQQAIEGKLKQAVAEAVDSVRSQWSMAKVREEGLQQALHTQEQQSLELDRKLSEYNPLKRTAEADRQLYDAIHTRMKETSVTSKIETSNIRLVDRARPPGSPIKPQQSRVVLIGVMLGLVGGVALSFLAHTLEDKIKSHEDVLALGLPQLSGTPQIEPQPKGAEELVVAHQPHSMAAESFNELRACLRLSPKANRAKVFLITSAAPGEGKSLIAANLAAVFANNAERTLLVDADLRHPSLLSIFECPPTAGLSHFLADATAVPTIISKTVVPNLDLVCAGKIPPSPSELLGGARLRELLEYAQQRYDRIIIDSPPVSVVSDALILLPHAEAVLFVVQFRKVRRRIIERTLAKLEECSAPLVGTVLNRIDLRHSGYYYYPYRYSYYYRKHNEAVAEPQRGQVE